ncbi:hypothetical protein SUGI_0088440 [Cryptomeria japonica]|nr:hypothetical protein SUGI_0088440 [Cryptomeria japonica]
MEGTLLTRTELVVYLVATADHVTSLLVGIDTEFQTISGSSSFSLSGVFTVLQCRRMLLISLSCRLWNNYSPLS